MTDMPFEAAYIHKYVRCSLPADCPRILDVGCGTRRWRKLDKAESAWQFSPPLETER